jgi:hypothetical protein
MQPARPYRPKVSRETRLLLTAAAVAIAVLWLLARMRFQELPASRGPIPAVLSQLASPSRFDDLAGHLAQIQARLQPLLVVLDSADAARRSVAIKLRDDFVVAHVPVGAAATPWTGTTLLAADAASGLAVASSMTAAAAPLPLPWSPPIRLQWPRYFFATRLAATGVSLHPVFVGSISPIETPLWPGQVWTVPPGTGLVPGAWLFSTDAELVGLVIAGDPEAVIVPSGLLLAEAERMLSTPPGSGGVIGVEVQALTPPIAAITTAASGVVVTAVDDEGPADARVRVGDLIEAADGQTLLTLQHWRVRIARLAPGDTLALRVRRNGTVQDVAVVAAAPPAAPPFSPLLGLALRSLPGLGAQVTRVDRGSAAGRAALADGDVITLIGDVQAPTPAQMLRAFNALGDGQRVMIAVTRGQARFVTVLER